MNEEKSMIEYKEPKGIFQWLKSKFEKLKEKFMPKRDMQQLKNESQDDQELFEEELDDVKAGIPFEAVNMKEPKSWNLTEEEQEIVEDGFKEIRESYGQQEQDEQELFEEDLDKITAGYPIIEEDEYSK